MSNEYVKPDGPSNRMEKMNSRDQARSKKKTVASADLVPWDEVDGSFLKLDGHLENDDFFCRSPIDDSDADPTYSPERNEDHLRKGENVNESSSPPSSPLRDEQRKTAEEIEKYMGDWLGTGDSPLLQEPYNEICDVEATQKSSSQVNHIPQEYEVERNDDDLLENLEQSNTGSSKKNYCKYCDTFQAKISRHFVRKHKNVPEILAYINLTDDDKKKLVLKKREACKLLINKSNKEYNCKVINQKETKLISVKKTKSEITTLSHVVCSECGALISRKYFFSHKIACTKRKELLGLPTTLESPTSALLFPTVDQKYSTLMTKVFPFMKKDMTSVRAQKDPLILEYGRRFFKGHRAARQRNYVASRMRTLSQIVSRIQSLLPNIKSLEDCLDAKHFDYLCEAVKTWSGYDEETGDCNVGSVPRRLCRMLKDCSRITASLAIRSESLTVEEKTRIEHKSSKFIHLMESDWPMEVNTVGDNTIKKNRNTNDEKLPIEGDVEKFCEFMHKLISKQTKNLNQKCTEKNYSDLVKSLLVFLTLSNGRRPSEVTWATLSNYELTIEKTENLAVFKVVAHKNGLKVPIVMPLFAASAIEAVISSRTQCGVIGTHIFSKCDGSVYNTSDLITKMKSVMDLTNPDAMTANGMRHYWATVSQKYPLIKRHMPKQLGHSTAVHEKFYEKTLNDIHLTVVGPLLFEKCLPNISAKESNSETSIEMVKNPKVACFSGESQPVSDECELEDEINILCTPPKKGKSTTSKYDDLAGSESDSTNSTPIAKCKRNRWITPEKWELYKGLTKTVLGLQQPGKGAVKEFWEKSKIVKSRHSLQMTRIEVSKYYRNEKKIKSPIRNKLLNIVNNKQ